jgi:hypothetical protein
LKNTIILISLFAGQLIASESEVPPGKLELTVQSSKYVSFTSSNIIGSKELISFDGKFIVLGKGIFGHFDLVAFDGSGKVIHQIKSNDHAYQRDQGAKVKNIALSIDNDTSCIKVDVSFHETRINPDVGACKP